MRLAEKSPPRVFQPAPGIAISDCGDVHLAADEQVTMVTASGRRMDVVGAIQETSALHHLTLGQIMPV